MADLASKTRGLCPICHKNVKKLKNGNTASHQYNAKGVKTTKCPGSGRKAKSLYGSR